MLARQNTVPKTLPRLAPLLELALSPAHTLGPVCRCQASVSLVFLTPLTGLAPRRHFGLLPHLAWLTPCLFYVCFPKPISLLTKKSKSPGQNHYPTSVKPLPTRPCASFLALSS